MFSLSYPVAFILCAYILPSLFLFHLLWLSASACLTRRPIAQVIKDTVVVQDDIFLPHPPGFLDPFGDKLRDECVLRDTSSVSSSIGSTDTVLSSIPESPTSSDESLLSEDFCIVHILRPTQSHILRGDITEEPYQYPFPGEAIPFPRRRTTSSRFISSFKRLSSPSRARRTSTPFSKDTDSVFHRVSTALRKKKEELKKPDDRGRPPKLSSRITGVRNARLS